MRKVRHVSYDTALEVRSLLLTLDAAKESEKPDDGADANGEHWITVHAKNGEGYRHIKIDPNGKIVGGDVPKSSHGKPIQGWWKGAQKQPPKLHQELEARNVKYVHPRYSPLHKGVGFTSSKGPDEKTVIPQGHASISVDNFDPFNIIVEASHEDAPKMEALGATLSSSAGPEHGDRWSLPITKTPDVLETMPNAEATHDVVTEFGAHYKMLGRTKAKQERAERRMSRKPREFSQVWKSLGETVEPGYTFRDDADPFRTQKVDVNGKKKAILVSTNSGGQIRVVTKVVSDRDVGNIESIRAGRIGKKSLITVETRSATELESQQFRAKEFNNAQERGGLVSGIVGLQLALAAVELGGNLDKNKYKKKYGVDPPTTAEDTLHDTLMKSEKLSKLANIGMGPGRYNTQTGERLSGPKTNTETGDLLTGPYKDSRNTKQIFRDLSAKKFAAARVVLAVGQAFAAAPDKTDLRQIAKDVVPYLLPSFAPAITASLIAKHMPGLGGIAAATLILGLPTIYGAGLGAWNESHRTPEEKNAQETYDDLLINKKALKNAHEAIMLNYYRMPAKQKADLPIDQLVDIYRVSNPRDKESLFKSRLAEIAVALDKEKVTESQLRKEDRIKERLAEEESPAGVQRKNAREERLTEGKAYRQKEASARAQRTGYETVIGKTKAESLLREFGEEGLLGFHESVMDLPAAQYNAAMELLQEKGKLPGPLSKNRSLARRQILGWQRAGEVPSPTSSTGKREKDPRSQKYTMTKSDQTLASIWDNPEELEKLLKGKSITAKTPEQASAAEYWKKKVTDPADKRLKARGRILPEPKNKSLGQIESEHQNQKDQEKAARMAALEDNRLTAAEAIAKSDEALSNLRRMRRKYPTVKALADLEKSMGQIGGYARTKHPSDQIDLPPAASRDYGLAMRGKINEIRHAADPESPQAPENVSGNRSKTSFGGESHAPLPTGASRKSLGSGTGAPSESEPNPPESLGRKSKARAEKKAEKEAHNKNTARRENREEQEETNRIEGKKPRIKGPRRSDIAASKDSRAALNLVLHSIKSMDRAISNVYGLSR